MLNVPLYWGIVVLLTVAMVCITLAGALIDSSGAAIVISALGVIVTQGILGLPTLVKQMSLEKTTQETQATVQKTATVARQVNAKIDKVVETAHDVQALQDGLLERAKSEAIQNGDVEVKRL